MSIPIDLLVRSRRRTIALVVKPDGTLMVRAPLRMPEGNIQVFVEAHAAWIMKHQEKARAFSQSRLHRYTEGELFYYLGQTYPLHLVPHQKPALTFAGGAFHLAESAQASAEEAFQRWYRGEARKIIPSRVSVLARQHHFSYQKIRITSARTRWGSCSTRGALSFTFRLVMTPAEIIDYVILHELVHTRVKNHSSDFWQRLRDIMPEYKTHVAWLRQNGRTFA